MALNQISIDKVDITSNLVRRLRIVIDMMDSPSTPDQSEFWWIDLLKKQVRSLRYGMVQIVVHDQRVVQVERTEKFRFEDHSARRTTDEPRGPSGTTGGLNP